ncbi:MAG TPA: molybdenum cofactor guanylyltransferase, partial [Acidobacteriaceae bacterium]|nr:molybdenum cofactor guanylyltransferase [Acidobacteriaceae bacterium]
MSSGTGSAPPSVLPVHGFVLAGGRSSRMGRDKALLRFKGRPMVEIAVERLRSFCAAVSIVGEREDLAGFGPVVRGERAGAGPAAGLEAGLRASAGAWAMFTPVDVPLVPEDLLRRWAEAVLAREGAGGRLSFLRAAGEPHPVMCLLHREC